VIKRGAIVIHSDPLEVTWHGMPVPLSPTEAHVFRAIALRGRATNQAIDEALEEFGSNPATRPVVMMRIRRKFMGLGSDDPFVRLGQHGVRLRIEADALGSSATVIGLSTGTPAAA
jgi:DNA-binding response OmpR family regulator